jgi:pseudouridine kinase
MKKIVVIGAMNIDILAMADPLHLHDSSIGSIQTSYGGVGRNIAENIARLGIPVSLCSVIGDDAFGSLMLAHSKEVGIDVSLIDVIPGERTSSYLAVSNQEDMVVGVNDMDITSHMSRAWADKHLPFLQQFDIVVLEPNISEDTLTYLIASLKDKWIIVDPVSAVKANRLLPSLSHISVLKCNLLELQELSKVDDIEVGMSRLISKGVKRVIVTQGKNDIHDATRNSMTSHTPIPTDIVNVTGAGDSFTAGITAGIALDYNSDQQIKLAMKMSRITLQSSTTVSEEMSRELIKEIQ